MNRLSCIALITLPLSLLPMLVAAQTQPTQAAEEPSQKLAEVVVTAQRRQESLTDVPTSITVFSQQAIEDNNLVNVLDYAQKTPNITVIDYGEHNTNGIAMRGISNQSGSLDQPFTLYVDDFAVEGIITNPQLQDVQRIEVLRGPQGTFFGRNAEAGAINITANKPGPTFEAGGFAGGGSFNTYNFSGMVNVPLTDNLFLRAVVSQYSTDGSVKNVNLVGGTSSDADVDARLALQYRASERLTLDLSYTRDDERIGLPDLVSTGYLAANTAAFFRLNAPILGGLGVYPQNTTEVNIGYPEHQEYYYDIANGRVRYDFDDFSVTSITGYGQATRKIAGSADTGPPDWFELFSTTGYETYSEELRAASRGTGPFEWTVGAIYGNNTYDLQENVYAGHDPNPFGLPPGFAAENLTIHRYTKSWAGFGNVDYHLTDALTLTYGARYTSDKTYFRNSYNGPAGPFNVLGPSSFSNYSNKFAIRYDLAKDLAAYVLADQGYRTGGVQAGPLPTFKPETVWNYEAGIKGSLADQRVRFALSVFRMDWSDMQVVTYYSTPPPNVSLLILNTNAAKAYSQGAEFEIRAKPTRDLELGIGVGYDDAKFQNFPNASIIGINGPVDLSGRPMIQAPEWTANADAQYNHAIGSAQGFIRAEWVYSGSYANELIALVPGAVPYFPYYTKSYDFMNFRVGASFKNYTLTAYVQNAFDKNYYTGTYDNLVVSGAEVVPHPRFFGARLDYKY